MHSAEFNLGLRTLYIVPSRFGALWLLTAALLLLVAIQTSSNSTLLLAFVMLGLMLLAMFLTHDSLQGLVLCCGQPTPSFSAEQAGYPLLLESACRRPPFRLQFRNGPVVLCDQLGVGVTPIFLPWTPQCRGYQLPPRLRIETIAPLGLFICWSRWTPTQPQLIWPRRLSGPVAELRPLQSGDGLDEWQDLRSVREGERPAVVDWTSAAKGRPLQAKVFGDPEHPDWILQPAPGIDPEQAREHLADRIWLLHQRGARYGLQIQDRIVSPGQGLRHRDACLEALAMA